MRGGLAIKRPGVVQPKIVKKGYPLFLLALPRGFRKARSAEPRQNTLLQTAELRVQTEDTPIGCRQHQLSMDKLTGEVAAPDAQAAN